MSESIAVRGVGVPSVVMAWGGERLSVEVSGRQVGRKGFLAAGLVAQREKILEGRKEVFRRRE